MHNLVSYVHKPDPTLYSQTFAGSRAGLIHRQQVHRPVIRTVLLSATSSWCFSKFSAIYTTLTHIRVN